MIIAVSLTHEEVVLAVALYAKNKCPSMNYCIGTKDAAQMSKQRLVLERDANGALSATVSAPFVDV